MQAGPLIADDDAVACALLARALDALAAPVFVDLADAKAEVRRRWLKRRGFSAVRPLTRMLYGRSQRYDDAAYLRGGWAGVLADVSQRQWHMKKAGRSAADAEPGTPLRDQYGFGGLIGGIFTVLSRNSLV